MTSCWLALCKVEWPQFWGCQHTSILSNPSRQAVLSGGGVEVEERERSSGAIPGHQEVLAQPSCLGYNMRVGFMVSKVSESLWHSAPKLCHLLSLCECRGSAVQPEWPVRVPSRAICCCYHEDKQGCMLHTSYIRMQLYHTWQPMEAKKSAHLLCKSGLAPRLGHSSSF